MIRGSHERLQGVDQDGDADGAEACDAQKHDQVDRAADVAEAGIGDQLHEQDGGDGAEGHRQLRQQELAHRHRAVADEHVEIGGGDRDCGHHHGPEQAAAEDLLEDGDQGGEGQVFHGALLRPCRAAWRCRWPSAPLPSSAS
jgi:hypothetical protein